MAAAEPKPTFLIRGGCYCGSNTFEFKGPVKFCAHCHCSICQRSAGAAFVTWVGVKDEFVVSVIRPTLVDYESSPGATRSFCSKCGTLLFFRSERWPGEYHVTRACIEGNEVLPTAHVFSSDLAPWLDLEHLTALPRYGGKTGVEPMPEKPAAISDAGGSAST